MMQSEFAELSWIADTLPHSKRFDDKYFCEENGLEEARYVFCAGNDLTARWQALSEDAGEFVLAETGFGCGLNFCTAAQLFKQHAPATARLHYVSIEQFPLKIEDLQKALQHWPQICAEAQDLINVYQTLQQQETVDLGRIKLTVLHDHVVKALDRMIKQGIKADAWFLDGFAPSKNPEMWSDDVFKRMATLSHEPTTLSTFTVAGDVVRGLKRRGFHVKKVRGYGRKRHMLKGVFS